MTLRTSLFNKGIYKSTLRRYIWGSVFYAILLFMITSMTIFFDVDPERYYRTMAEHGPLILDNGYLHVPLVIAFFVPTVVALLVYRFVHAKKTSVFVHSLPVTRSANYISTVLAALTLMAAPVILNGAILCIMSLTAYGAYFDIASCLIWTGMNLLTIFLMFSASSVAAFLTGNSFALVALNGLLHCIAIIIAASFTTLGSVFLYGYYETNALINLTTEWNFVGYIIGLANWFSYNSDIIPFDFIKLAIMIALALVLYVAAYLLYKKRRMETAEDVAAYKVLNPIFKYLLTFVSALGTFGLFSYTLEEGAFIVLAYPIIISAIIYFAAEMILKKSLRIWKAYKGYLVFLVVFALTVSTFAFTGFFGFETRVPETDEVESTAIYTSRAYTNEPYMISREVAEYTINAHSALVEKENIYTLRSFPNDRTEYLYISYKLKNGGMMHRCYPVTEAYFCEVMDDLYEMDGYKEATLEIFSEEIAKVISVSVMHGEYELEGKQAEELLACIRADVLALDYTEMRSHSAWNSHTWINYLQPEEEEISDERGMHQTMMQINASFNHTVAYLKNGGLLDKTFNAAGHDLTILTAEQWRVFENEELELDMNPNSADARVLQKTANEVTVEAYKRRDFNDIPGAVRISDAGKKAEIREFVQTTPVRYVPGKEYAYYVCTIEPENNTVNVAAAFYDDVKLPAQSK